MVMIQDGVGVRASFRAKAWVRVQVWGLGSGRV